MKKSIIFLTFLVSVTAIGQTFEMAGQKYPYNDIIEWKGMGALLMSSDPSGKMKQVTLTLVGNQETSIWDQKFIPKGDEYYYVSSENARYVYFLDNLELLPGGKISVNQLNSAGNVKVKTVSVVAATKKIGVSDYNDLELINVVVTDKALVHHFRYYDKKAKSTVEIATFITHHNFLCYAVELGVITDASKKDENVGQWDFIGFTGDQIFFAARDVLNKKSGWTIKEYSSKGKPGTNYFVDAPAELLAVENIGFGTTGKYYLEDKTTIDKGLLSYINGTFYLVGGQKKGNGAELTLYKLEEGEWKELNTMQLSYFIEKKPLKLGIYPLNEGVGYHLDHNGYNKASVITFSSSEKAAHNTFTDRTIYNPSSVFSRKEKEEFSVTLGEIVLTFNTDQLKKAGPVTFELSAR